MTSPGLGEMQADARACGRPLAPMTCGYLKRLSSLLGDAALHRRPKYGVNIGITGILASRYPTRQGSAVVRRARRPSCSVIPSVTGGAAHRAPRRVRGHHDERAAGSSAGLAQNRAGADPLRPRFGCALLVGRPGEQAQGHARCGDDQGHATLAARAGGPSPGGG
jgi:hypothetical protein